MPASLMRSPETRRTKVAAAFLMSSEPRSMRSSMQSSAGDGKPARRPSRYKRKISSARWRSSIISSTGSTVATFSRRYVQRGQVDGNSVQFQEL
jgi:hypothetical protein